MQNEIASMLSQKIELEVFTKKILEEMEVLRLSTSENSVTLEVRFFYSRLRDRSGKYAINKCKV